MITGEKLLLPSFNLETTMCEVILDCVTTALYNVASLWHKIKEGEFKHQKAQKNVRIELHF